MHSTDQVDVFVAALAGDYDEVTRLLNDKQIWSRNGIWRFKRKCEELTGFLETTALEMEEE